MNSKMTAVIAVVCTALVVMLVAGLVTTPEMITQILMGCAAFFVTGLALLVLLCLPWMRTLPQNRQTLSICTVAAISGIAVCFVSLLIVLLRM